jgi:CheY-like chemotaxis protein
VTASVRNADDALAAARGRRFDLVLTDADLPGGRDGVDAAEAVRADHDVPAVVVAAAPERIPRTRLHRPDRVVRKPCDDDALAAALDRALPADPTAPVA